MSFKNIFYIFMMIIMIVISYFLLDRGVNTKTKVYVNYKDENKVIYKVYLKNSDKYIEMNNKYDASLVNKINFDFDLKTVFSNKVNGYYKYNVEGILVVYTDNINDSLLRKKYILANDVVNTLNKNSNSININNNIDIDYTKYKEELEKVSREHKTSVNGYLELRFNVFETLNFNGMDNIKEDSRQIKVIIPLSYDSFKININNDNKIDSYYDFSKKQPVNYFFILLGALFLAFGISYLALVIKNIVLSYDKEIEYKKRLKKIVEENKDILVKTEKFYNKKKYNLIYIYSFSELASMSKKMKEPISYKEVRRNTKTIFLLVEGDNAWIYQLVREQ